MRKKIDFSHALNPEQLAVVRAGEGPLFVLAAAGTGKTRTLIYRVAHLIERGVDAQRILLLTFTNRAAHEMLMRTETLVGKRVGGLWGGTFHHMANRILRRYANMIGYCLDFTILDRDDSRTLIRSCLEELNLNNRTFPKPGILISLFSASANKQIPLEQLIEAQFGEFKQNGKDILQVFHLYNQKKQRLKAMDFDDLLLNSLLLLKNHHDILAKYQDQFLHILVDEYQDTNLIQAECVDMLAAKHRNVMVVGDDFQSIYSWRGADYRNILTFPKRYSDAQRFMLETNYRSVPEILELANTCIAGNPSQFQKVLRSTRNSHNKPILALVRDGVHQARYVIEQANKLHRQGCDWRDIVVLYRAHYHAMDMQLQLAREQIPYVVISGVRFFEQAHIKDVCSLLRLLENPADEMAFIRLVSLLPGVGPRTSAKIWKKLGHHFAADNRQQRTILLNQLPFQAKSDWKPVNSILSAYVSEHLNDQPGETVLRFLKAFYDEYLLNMYDDYSRRLEDIQEMSRFTSDFESTEAFLSEVALITNVDAEAEREVQQAGDAIRLSTVHQAKGLEWKAVFILWLAEGMFPSERAIREAGDDQEERRLFYVALTRAKDELVLCLPVSRRSRNGEIDFLSPSRFINELPPEGLQEVRLI